MTLHIRGNRTLTRVEDADDHLFAYVGGETPAALQANTLLVEAAPALRDALAAILREMDERSGEILYASQIPARDLLTRLGIAL